MTGSERKIRVPALARVEGEGGLFVRLRGNQVQEIRLDIYEPPRFFESLLRGRHFHEVPDITARICGICPVAYQMSSVHALEAALGHTPSPEIHRLRRLLYCGEWIESHCLHIHLLHAPDFFGYPSGLHMAADYPDEVKRGLRLKKHGNELLDLFGGRAIHPINVTVGGFYRLPTAEAVRALLPHFEWGLSAAVEMARWVAAFPFEPLAPDYEFVSLVHPDEYPMNAGHIASTRGLLVPAADFEQHFAEQQVPHSTALHCVRTATQSTYLVGPLSRVNQNLDRLSPTARRLADQLHVDWPCTNPAQSIIARALEVVHAYDEALSILRDYRRPASPRVELPPVAASGAAATEAPRGLLYHRYEIDNAGLVRAANIVPPTSQNQGQIESDLRQLVARIADQPDAAIEHSCERLVRSYDPCISCSTHFLKLTLERGSWRGAG
jgi:coenzyme F420-reducing hydrogenase alpha subunit